MQSHSNLLSNTLETHGAGYREKDDHAQDELYATRLVSVPRAREHPPRGAVAADVVALLERIGATRIGSATPAFV